MTLKSTAIPSIVLTGALTLAAITGAQAVPSIKLDDGAGHVAVVSDGGVGDANPTAGAVTFIGSLGVWFLNVSTGISKPILGDATLPHMDLNSVDASSGGAGALTIYFSDDFFGPSGGSVTASTGGTSAGLVNYSSFYDTTNTLFATTNALTNQSFIGGGAFSGTSYSSLDLPAEFSLTQKITIQHAGSGISSFDAEFSVPDAGSTVALLGFALLGVEGFRRRYSTLGKEILG